MWQSAQLLPKDCIAALRAEVADLSAFKSIRTLYQVLSDTEIFEMALDPHPGRCSLPAHMKWNPEDYARGSDIQLLWAQQLRSRLTFHPGESLLDVGCGDGKITADFIGLKVAPGNVAQFRGIN